MRSLRRFYFVAACALVAACTSSGPTDVSYESGPLANDENYVTVTAKAEGLVVVNQTELPVFYFAVERTAAAYTGFVTCGVSLALCVGINPGASVTIPWSNVAGFRPEAVEYLFSWYHVIPVNGTLLVTSMTNVIVKR
jgi:hypothetical protein